MPSASSVTLTDSGAVDFVFAPRSVTASSALLVNDDSNTSAGAETVVLGFSGRSNSRPTDRVSIRYNMPIEQSVDGVYQVAFTARAHLEVTLPDQMTATNRADFKAKLVDLISESVVGGYIADLDPMY